VDYFNQIFSLPLLEQVLLLVLVVAVFIQLFYFLFFYLRLAFHKEKGESEIQNRPVSIIVCSKNEEKNLRRIIPEIMDQDYPDFQLVVVDDQSWDGSPGILSTFKLTYPDLHVVELRENKVRMQGKKFALSMGIRAAKYDQLLLTDADCSPNSNQWIKRMIERSIEKPIVLGYSPYEKRKGLLNVIIRYDAFVSAVQYLSFAKAGIPYMGVGRNLAYRKEMFFEVGGFRKHNHISSGDDDLFINQVAKRNNTTICINKEAFVFSKPKTKWKDWVLQKRRHLTTAPHYKFRDKFLLSLFPMVYTAFVLSAVSLLFLHTLPLLVISIIALRFMVQLITFINSSRPLGEMKLAWFSPFLELALMTLNTVIYLRNMINKPKEWK